MSGTAPELRAGDRLLAGDLQRRRGVRSGPPHRPMLVPLHAQPAAVRHHSRPDPGDHHDQTRPRG